MKQNKPYTPFSKIYKKYKKTTNPVTKSVYRDIMLNRLDRME